VGFPSPAAGGFPSNVDEKGMASVLQDTGAGGLKGGSQRKPTVGMGAWQGKLQLP
jgi:hypothetical protein